MKHSEQNKENNQNLWSFFNCKVWMPWSIFINEVSFKSREKAVIHQIKTSKLTSPSKSPFWCMCCITYTFSQNLTNFDRNFYIFQKLSKLHKKRHRLHVTITFLLKQEQTRGSSWPITLPLTPQILFLENFMFPTVEKNNLAFYLHFPTLHVNNRPYT